MKILVHYDFTEEQVQAMQALAARHGSQLVGVKDEEAAIAQVADAEALLGQFKPSVCAAAPKLRWIQSYSAGMNNFLFPEIVERDVVVTNMAGVYAPQGGEHAWAMLLALTRGIDVAVEAKREREWRGGATVELTGGTLGVIGLGGFGMETVKRAQGYDMTIVGLDPVRTELPPGVAEVKPPTPDNLTRLLERSDVVVVACPLTDDTYHLIGERELEAMKKSAYLICTTRGGIIDETALAAGLTAGEIAGAGLDVCQVEPLPAESPLWTAPNLILTPHRAGASQHRPRKIFEFFCANLERYLKGEELVNVVDKRRGF